ncbi:MAG: integrase arm-type DNA-binding domain-containing protein, partial [Deltaproteobacteria bacterium]|nr:integrase arm-type DNA-binding domain-containing protein [Deltaproteobacteria bacterium]
MKLTDTFLRAVKATGKAQKHPDGGGLYMYVSPTGGKLWRMDYRFDGKRKTLSMGGYPAVSLADARARRQAAKVQLVQGIDPCAHKQAIKTAVRAETENTFEVVAREWFDKNKSFWVDTHAEKIIRRMENYIFPLIGGKPVNQIAASELLAALRRMEEQGAPDAAHRALQNCGRIFRYAIATG